MGRNKDWVPVNVQREVHLEIKVASAHRGESISAVMRKAWEAFKAKEGKRLHEPVGKEVSRVA